MTGLLVLILFLASERSKPNCRRRQTLALRERWPI
jgi:hypothetical protein